MSNHLSLHLPLMKSSVMSAPVQTATMNYCIELARQALDSLRQSPIETDRNCFSLYRGIFVGSLSARRNAKSRDGSLPNFLIFPSNESSDSPAIVSHTWTFITLLRSDNRFWWVIVCQVMLCSYLGWNDRRTWEEHFRDVLWYRNLSMKRQMRYPYWNVDASFNDWGKQGRK